MGGARLRSQDERLAQYLVIEILDCFVPTGDRDVEELDSYEEPCTSCMNIDADGGKPLTASMAGVDQAGFEVSQNAVEMILEGSGKFAKAFGNLYHLNAEEEPEELDYPRQKNLEYKMKFGPRGVLRTRQDRL